MKTPLTGFVLWFTGLACSGKTTTADALHEKLIVSGYKNIQRLDGDEVRTHLCKDLGFSQLDRETNLGRIGFVAELLSKNGAGVIATFISPFEKDRAKIRHRTHNYIEVFVDTSLEVCEKRDVKGMYARARAGTIGEFTGVSSPYEIPQNPEIIINTEDSVEVNCQTIIEYLKTNNFIHPNT